MSFWKIQQDQNKLHFLEYLDCHESDAWIKTKSFLFEMSSTNQKYSMEISVEGIIPVITEKYEFD